MVHESTQREFDLTVLGASGFTGALIVEYLLDKQKEHNLRIALAGRNPDKLEELKKRLESVNPRARDFTLIPADTGDQKALDHLAARTRVLISTVGPYVQYGEGVVAACIRGGADYLDITGEGAFVDLLLDKYNDAARDRKVRIINCCGFDSIPADLGTYFTVKNLPSDEDIEVKCFVDLEGDDLLTSLNAFSGGTFHSALGFMSMSELDRQNASFERINQSAPRKILAFDDLIERRTETGSWGIMMPVIDREIVLRSAAQLEKYGKSFTYGHFAHFSGLPTLGLALAGFGSLFALAQIDFIKNLIKNLRPAGAGPDAENRSKTRFALNFQGRSRTRFVKTRFSGGDPGYGETSKMVSEAAFCLLKERDSLPVRYGVLTPTLALGDNLLNRLSAAGLKIEIINDQG